MTAASPEPSRLSRVKHAVPGTRNLRNLGQYAAGQIEGFK